MDEGGRNGSGTVTALAGENQDMGGFDLQFV
jgi:hypothetical protein